MIVAPVYEDEMTVVWLSAKKEYLLLCEATSYDTEHT